MNDAIASAPRKNIDFVSYSDQGGRGDGVQIMVHKGHAYIGHMFSNGVTVLDVSDPKNPRPVNFLPTRRAGLFRSAPARKDVRSTARERPGHSVL